MREIALDRRRGYRRKVDTAAVVRQGQSIVTGTVRDTSAGGVFFVPECGYVDGILVTGDTLCAMIDDGMLEITIADESGSNCLSGHVRVCWRGVSLLHGAKGIGLEWRCDAGAVPGLLAA